MDEDQGIWEILLGRLAPSLYVPVFPDSNIIKQITGSDLLYGLGIKARRSILQQPPTEPEAMVIKVVLPGEGAYTIIYNDMEVTLPRRHIDEALEDLKDDDGTLMESVNKNLGISSAAIRNNRATKWDNWDFTTDVAIWFANEVLQGRQTYVR